MPKWLHDKLAKTAKKKGLKKGSDRWGAYVYGTMNKLEKEGVKMPSKSPKKKIRRK